MDREGVVVRALAAALAISALAPGARAEPDWSAAGDQASRMLAGYIQLDTTNGPVPPGVVTGHETRGARYLGRFFEDERIDYEILGATPQRDSVIARLPATHPDGTGAVLLLSHLDVVPAEPEDWAFPPYSGEIAGGFVYGRGALDDKGQGIVNALALALLAREELPRRREVVFAATAAEEAGFDLGADWLVEHHWQKLGPPAVVWNEGGFPLRSPLVGDRVLNAIATTEKRSLWMTLRATGPGGHGSQPIPGGAADRVVRAVGRILDHPTPVRVTPTVAETMRRAGDATEFPLSTLLRNISNPVVLRLASGRLEANPSTNAMVRDTIALTGLGAGVKHNVIPRAAEARLDVRLLPDTDAERFLAWLRVVIADPAIEIELEPDGDHVAARRWRERVLGDPDAPVPDSPVDNELFQALERELAVELPDSITVPLQSPGGSDSKWFRARGVPAYGFMPALIDEELLTTVHGLDERIPVAELTRALRVTYRVLLRLVTAPEAEAPTSR
jgi:acetylornithine deacetylase/succinyl-diaminopimelate desuccinylase-like protein